MVSVPAERLSDHQSHLSRSTPQQDTSTCPWCDQPIAPEKRAEVAGRIAAREHNRFSEMAARLQEQFNREKMQADIKAGNELERVRKEAAENMERLRRDAQQKEMASKVALENELNRRLREQRDALERDRAQALQQEQAKVFEERQKMQARVMDLQKQLDTRIAQEMGEGANINIFETLRAEFPYDQVARIARSGSTAGADISHYVLNNGKICGRLVYGTAVHGAWRNDYITRLRQDQLTAQADHAILVSSIFPSGARQLHIQDNVIVVNPARALMVVHMLRKHLHQMNALRLSNEARDLKTARLYEFMTSERCTQLLDQMRKLSDDLLDIDVKEKRAHDLNWKKRGEIIRNVQRAQGDFSMEIERIIGTAATARQV